MFTATKATGKLLKLDKRIRAVAGGTSASKTISILLILIDKAQASDGLLISVVSESLPHLKRGVMRDFLNIMQQHKYYKDALWNRTDFVYTFETGSRIEFFGVDSPDKVRGPRRDILFMNEANNCPYNSFDQLEVRTRDEIWLDWNPTNEFWFYTEVLPHRGTDTDFVTLTYLDNDALDPNIVKSIEARKHNKSWWKVYGLGELGEVEGKIYKDWKIIDEIPHEARIERLGLDFGYANDPAVLIALYFYNGGYIIDELLHRTHMSNAKVADYINNWDFPNTLVIADSAEPKSIAEMQEYGINIIGAQKGPGSRNQGIQFVQDQRISVTKRSTNVIKSYRNYMWRTDREGNIIDIPDHNLSDAMDACLVADTLVRTKRGDVPIQNITTKDKVLTRKGYKRVLSAGLTGKNKKLYELTVGDKKLVGTGNHPIYTQRGWVDLRDIRYADRLVLCKQPSATKTRTTTSIPSLSSYTADVISTMERTFYIGKSTPIPTGLYQRVCTFITKTTTHLITALKTLNFSQTQSMVNVTGKKKYPSLRLATNVWKPSMISIAGVQTVSVPINVKASGVETQGLMTSQSHVAGVKNSSHQTSTGKSPIVLGHAPIVAELSRRANVYNLEVEGEHEYFANGILVHNCRYSLETMRPSESDAEEYSSGNFASSWSAL